jgi:signal transduction histidine kinase
MSSAQHASSRSSFFPELVLGEKASALLVRAGRSGLWFVLFGLGYYLTARLSHGVLFQRSRIGLVWVPNALLLSAFILTSRRSWWMILAVASVAHVLALGPWNPAWRMAWQIPVHVGFVIATTEVLRRLIGFPLRFESRREVCIYTGVAFVMPLMVALTAPGFVLSAAGVETLFSPSIELLRLFLANVTPLLVVAPAVLLCARLNPSSLSAVPRRRVVEAAMIMGSVVVASIIVFDSAPELARFPWLLVLAFPPLIWAAVRLGPTGASVSLLCVWALSILGADRQLGPFVITTSDDVVFSLQLFWIAITLPVLLLAAVNREREHGATALDDQRTQLAHATRIATAGELSGALAHELRQPLTAILANAQAATLMLAKQPLDVAALRATLAEIEREDLHAASVITHLRLFLRDKDSRFEPVSVERVIRDALALSGNTLALAQVEVQSQLADDLPRVRGDAVQLLQVVLNLIVNGCDAMRGTPVPSRRLRVQVDQPDAHHVEILVADSGIGLPNDVERVFEPFFTTKPEGLGLGLPIARSIAKAHGGRLRGETNQRGGATFRLVLPAESSIST